MKIPKINFDSLKNEGTSSVSDAERRAFLKIGLAITGVYAGGKILGVLAAGDAQASSSAASKYKYSPHYAMVIRQDRCVDCERCMEACKTTNKVPEHGYRTRILEHSMPEASTGVKHEFIPVLCNQCNNPPCVRACPTKATYKDQTNGIVMMNYDKCIGCKTCMVACAYNARYLNPETRTVDKCNFCADTRLAKGEKLTACAAACPAQVRIFGDISTPGSEVFNLVYQLEKPVWVMRPESGAEPNVFYTKGQ